MSALRTFLLRLLPAGWRRAAKRRYYPWVLRRFSAERWPGASVVARLVRPGELVVDAGANIGYVSMLLARWVGPSGLVYSFEPMPETFSFLAHNMQALGLRQVRPHRIALSNQSGEGHMAVPEYPQGGPNFYEAHLVAADAPGGQGGILLRRLDDLLQAEPRPIAFMKVDVEGHEWELAQGARQRLERDRPALFVEMSGPPRGEGASAQLVRYLAGLGYTACWLDGETLKPVGADDHPVDAFFLTAAHQAHLGLPARA